MAKSRIPYTGESQKRTDAMRATMQNKKGYASGGRVHSYPKMEEGSLSGEGRLDKIEAYGKNSKK